MINLISQRKYKGMNPIKLLKGNVPCASNIARSGSISEKSKAGRHYVSHLWQSFFFVFWASWLTLNLLQKGKAMFFFFLWNNGDIHEFTKRKYNLLFKVLLIFAFCSILQAVFLFFLYNFVIIFYFIYSLYLFLMLRL